MPNKLLENAQTPISRVHAVLGTVLYSKYTLETGYTENAFSPIFISTFVYLVVF